MQSLLLYHSFVDYRMIEIFRLTYENDELKGTHFTVDTAFAEFRRYGNFDGAYTITLPSRLSVRSGRNWRPRRRHLSSARTGSHDAGWQRCSTRKAAFLGELESHEQTARPAVESCWSLGDCTTSLISGSTTTTSPGLQPGSPEMING